MNEKFSDYVNKLKHDIEATKAEKKDESVQTEKVDNESYQQQEYCEDKSENESTQREKESIQNSQRKGKCKYWNRGFCLK